MNSYLFALAGSICFLLTGLTAKAQGSSGTLIIEASNFESQEGIAIVSVFRENDDIPKNPYLQGKEVIANGKATIIFKDVPFGEYAAILFHDENANGILDHKFGFPNEPMGFSNDWDLSLFSSMPTFKKLKFQFNANDMRCEIVLN